jgi:hypothetical protein
MFLRNVGVYLQVHMALQSRRPTSTWYNIQNLHVSYDCYICLVALMFLHT